MRFIPWLGDYKNEEMRAEGLSYGSINFVDEDNKVLGYNYSACCCENFGFKISRAGETLYSDCGGDLSHAAIQEINNILNGYRFTGQYTKIDESGDSCDIGGSISFFVEDSDGDILSIVFYNYHNGYYSHGFSFTQGEDTITTGAL